MEKISRIIHGDKRITTVDMRHSGVSRPGSPSFGREVGVSPGHHPEFNTNARAMQRFEEEMRTRAVNAKAAMVERMADRFFVRQGRDENAQPMKSAALESGHRMNVVHQLQNEIEQGNGPQITAPGIQQSRVEMPVQIGQPTNSGAQPQSQSQSQENADQLVSGQHLDVRV